MNQREAREAALAALYQIDLADIPEDQALQTALARCSQEARAYAAQLVHGTCALREKIDEILVARTSGWQLDRIAVIDRNLLRLALYEMIGEGLSPGIAIDEAVEIAKKYGTADSYRFINGVLSRTLDDVTRIRKQQSNGE
ncbi:MAG: transcription antitermination factor NusB [Firmicutes bacterium]|nr:transcription antitermination factor NusB [Bacillota bacterium]